MLTMAKMVYPRALQKNSYMRAFFLNLCHPEDEQDGSSTGEPNRVSGRCACAAHTPTAHAVRLAARFHALVSPRSAAYPDPI
jgi:hypothetical protein